MPDDHVPQLRRLDVGSADFSAMRLEDRYYVDKTGHLPQLLDGRGPLLLTRPRRFGKTLTMRTLQAFLELDYEHPGDTARHRRLFEGLAIMEEPHLRACREAFMGQFPVVSVSLATVEGECYEEALAAMSTVIQRLFSSFEQQLTVPGLGAADRALTAEYLGIRQEHRPQRLTVMIRDALSLLTDLLHRIHGRPVFVLIDEYDTPLARAWSAEHRPLPGQDHPGREGYYARMAALMRGLLQPLLKPHGDHIARCVLTGCTRVSRESLFSGANNLQVLGMDSLRTATLMGFTEEEVAAMLDYYGLAGHLGDVQRWYNGYQFAGVSIYNPWSIAGYCAAAAEDGRTAPVSYWAHSGRNDELRLCLQELPAAGLERLRRLGDGEQAALPIREALSYEEMLGAADHAGLFTLLWHTGYVTQGDDTAAACAAGERVMRIPNAEVRECFEQQILELYERLAGGRGLQAARLGAALLSGHPADVHLALNELLGHYLSFHAFAVRSGVLERLEEALLSLRDPAAMEDFAGLDDRRPERIYQVYVAVVLSGLAGGQLCDLTMERELGGGLADLSCLAPPPGRSGCVLEFKQAAAAPGAGEEGAQAVRARAARQALSQILERDYAGGLLRLYPQLQEVHAYGIGCAGKGCAVTWRRCVRGDMRCMP